MKKSLILTIAILLVVSGVALARISGSPHDFSSLAAKNAPEVCATCHTPHNGLATNGPLWNRSVVGAATYTDYSTTTFDMSVSGINYQIQSLACLTCHDGRASNLVNYPGPGSTVDARYQLGAGEVGTLGNNQANLGTDLSDDHPIGFVFNQALDSDFVVTIPATLPTYSGQIECATCHAVHHDGSDVVGATGNYSDGTIAGSDQVYFLRITNTGSSMCLTCHIK